MNYGDYLGSKFLLLEMSDNNKLLIKNNKWYSLTFTGKYLLDNDVLTIYDYLNDSNGAIFLLDLPDYFLVNLIYKNEISVNYYMFQYNFEQNFFKNKEIIDNIDKKNIITHFFHTSKLINIEKKDNFPFNCTHMHGQHFKTKALFFKKPTFSKKEVEYWANTCLRLYCTFFKKLNTYAFLLRNERDLSIIIRYLNNLLLAVDGNVVTFFLEASMEYTLKLPNLIKDISLIKINENLIQTKNSQ